MQPSGQAMQAAGQMDVSGGMVILVSHNTVSLSWQASNDSRVQGYYVYKGTDPKNLGQNNVGAVTSYKFSNLDMGKTWYFAVSSYGTDGKKKVESARSATVSKFISLATGKSH